MWLLTLLWLISITEAYIVKDYCPERQKYAYYISDVAGSDLFLQDSCVSTSDDGIVVVGWRDFSSTVRVGLTLKIGHTGDVKWALQSTDATGLSQAISVSCDQNFAYVGGDATINTLAIGSGSNVYVIKYVSDNGQKLWAKSLGQSGISPNTDKMIALTVTPYRYYVFVAFQSTWSDASTNLRFARLHADLGTVDLVKGIQTRTANAYAGASFPQFGLYFYSSRLLADENFLFLPHRVKGAYGVSPSQYSGAIVKMQAEDLRVEWYRYSQGGDFDDSLDTMVLLEMTKEYVAGGCYRSTGFSMSAGSCDLTFIKGKQIDGSIVWARTSGGSQQERLRSIFVMPLSEAVIWLIGSVASASYSSQGSVAEMFISKHSAATGSLLSFNVILSSSATQSSFFTSGHLLISDKGSHLVLMGHSSDALRFSFQTTSQSMVFFKVDVSLEDTQCFSAITPTFSDIKTAFSNSWTLITSVALELHTEIEMVDRLGTYATTNLVRNTHYYKLTTDCLTLTRIPTISNKEIAVGEALDADVNDKYDMPNYCLIDQEKTWTDYQLIQGGSKPVGLTLDVSSQTFTGKFSTPGIYTIQMLGNTDAQPRRASAVFTITIKNQGALVISEIPDQTMRNGDFLYLTLDSSKLFKDLDSDSLALSAYSWDGSTLPKWLRFYPNNNTLIGSPQMIGSYQINITAKDQYLTEATISFKILVIDKRPKTIKNLEDICIYQDDPYANFKLVRELPSFAEDLESDLLTYSLISMSSGATLPSFISFDPSTLLLKKSPTVPLGPPTLPGTWQLQLQAADALGQTTLASFTLRLLPLRPQIVTGNASCTGYQTYRYLDNEPEGEYVFSLASCFTGSTQMRYRGTYSEGGDLSDGAVIVNSTNGEVKVRAWTGLAGEYRVKMSAIDECGGEANMFFSIIINSPPFAKSLTFPIQQGFTFEPFFFRIPDDWFTDPDGQVLRLKPQIPPILQYHWLKFSDGSHKALLGTPTFDQKYTIPIVAEDPYGASVTSIVEINVRVNKGPILIDKRELKFEVKAGEAFVFDIPVDKFIDLEGDEIQYYLDNSGYSWFYFNPITTQLAGQAPSLPQTIPLTLFAQDHPSSFLAIPLSLHVLPRPLPHPPPLTLSLPFNSCSSHHLLPLTDLHPAGHVHYSLVPTYDNHQHLPMVTWYPSNRTILVCPPQYIIPASVNLTYTLLGQTAAGLTQRKEITLVIAVPQQNPRKRAYRQAVEVMAWVVVGVVTGAAVIVVGWVEMRGKKRWREKDEEEEERLKEIKEVAEMEELAERLAQ